MANRIGTPQNTTPDPEPDCENDRSDARSRNVPDARTNVNITACNSDPTMLAPKKIQAKAVKSCGCATT